MKIACIIPARAGSKRLPGKNLMTVGGVSLLGRALASANGAGPGLLRCVTTDCEHVIAQARTYAGVIVVQRPPELALDEAAMEPVVEHALRASVPGRQVTVCDVYLHDLPIADACDAIILLQPTSPLRTAAHVAQAAALLRDGAPGVVSVNAHPYTAVGKPGKLTVENGAIYAVTMAAWREHGTLRVPGAELLAMDAASSIDVDTAEDMAMAEAYVRYRGAA